MKTKCMLDNHKYENKPKGFEIGKIVNRLEKAECDIDIKELAGLLVQGCTFRPAFLDGRKEENWISQQLFALDFDEDTTIEEELNRCKELNILPVFGYTSFSHKEDHHKFRLVFCSDKIITTYEDGKRLQLTLMSIFDKCDEHCKNLSRLYFGGRELIYEGYENRINTNELNIYKIVIDNDSNRKYNNKFGRKGVQDKDNINNINYILYPKNPLSDTIDDMYNIKAISKHNVDYLKDKIGNKDKMIFETNQQFLDYIYKIDLGKLLELNYPIHFKCLFHEDNNPSASIFQDEETGNYIYKCNSSSCGVSYNIVGVIERLGKFKSRPKTYQFIKDIFNLEVMETDWQKEQKEILIENLKSIHNGELEKNCPQAYKNNKRIMRYLEQMHLIALDNIYNEKLTDKEGNVLFFASTSYIAEKLNISKNSLNKISQKMAVLTYHKLLNKIDDGEINDNLLKKSKHLNAKNNNDTYKHINYYSIPSYTYNNYPAIEKQGIKWKENNYTMKGVSREMFYRAEGKEVANWIYPQFNKVTEKNDKGENVIVDRTTTNASNNKTIDIVKVILYLIDNKGYVLEKEIVEILQGEYGKENIKTQIKKSMQEILDAYGLQRIRVNKKIKENYGITGNGYPFIIVNDRVYQQCQR